MLIINADDWGRDKQTTDRIHDCVKNGTVSSVSAMVFMEDSRRAAGIARQDGVCAGLHLNLTTAFSARGCSPALMRHQQRVSRFLTKFPAAQVLFHPGLASSFEYLVQAQREEYAALYGREAERLDGHHHMHLCANVLFQGLLPRGTMVRRNFSFRPGEKSLANRIYRGWVDSRLARRHRLTDYFFSIAPLEPRQRLEYVFSLAKDAVVEVETHPVDSQEHTFLSTGEIFRVFPGISIATSGVLLAPRVG